LKKKRRVIQERIMRNNDDPYHAVQTELDQALAERDSQLAAGACRRASLALARVASGPGFDPRRHRAIAAAIRDASRGPGPGMPSGGIAPLSTRGAR
jgi:hypothetical protein